MTRYNDYSATLDIAPVFPSFTPSRETTINDFLTKDLELTERILGYNIYVNGKEIDLDFWSDFAISPEDKVILAPYIGLLEEVHAIEAKIMIEGSQDWNKQESLLLDSIEIKTLYEFYSRLSEPAYDKASLQSGTPSKYTPHFKFLIDESIRILVDNNVINKKLSYLDRVKSLSKIISTSQSERAVTDAFNQRKIGYRFDLAESYLMSWYTGIWFKIEKAHDQGNILSAEDKNIALYELDKLMNAQYKLYGIGKPSKVYLPMKQSYEKLRKVIYEETNICPDKNINTFNSIFHFSPHWSDKNTYINPDHVPNIALWRSLCSNIISELKSRSLDHLIPVINSIEEEIFDIIIYISDGLLADKPNWPKIELLEMIINCPETDILKSITQLKELSFILFNHPNYGISADKSHSYLLSVYFKKEGIQFPTINALLHRISTLTINDFKTIGLGDKLNDADLKALKEHAKEAVSNWIKKYGLDSYKGVGTTYRTKELRDLQLNAFRALWTAVAYREDNFFLSYPKMAKAFGLNERYFTKHITKPKMMTDKSAKRLIGKLNQFILEESYITPLSYGGIVNMGTSLHNFNKIPAYLEAKEKLIQYQDALIKAKESWVKTKTLSWFDNLFEPSNSESGYSRGFEYSELYKAWLVVMGLFELFGTDPMTGESIPNAAFDNNDKLTEFADHHMESANTMSNALYDIILTWGKGGGYHQVPYESFSKLNGIHSQRLLKCRLRKLFEIGFNKDESAVTNGQWITKADFQAMFPNNLEYEVEYRKPGAQTSQKYKGSLYYLWNNVFTRESFQDKLTTINNKITCFREALSKGENPHVAVLSDFSPAAESRFLEKASKFADRFWMLGSEHKFSGHKADELARIWQVYLMKKTFNLD